MAPEAMEGAALGAACKRGMLTLRGCVTPPVLGNTAPRQQSHQLTAQAANWPCLPQFF